MTFLSGHSKEAEALVEALGVTDLTSCYRVVLDIRVGAAVSVTAYRYLNRERIPAVAKIANELPAPLKRRTRRGNG